MVKLIFYILSPILLSLDKLNNSGYFVVGNGWFGIPLASLNGSKPDIVLSNTPPKLTSIFAHMYFAWKLFAWQNGLGPSWTKLYTPCSYHQLFVLYCTATCRQPGLSIVNQSQELNEPLRPITGFKIGCERAAEQCGSGDLAGWTLLWWRLLHGTQVTYRALQLCRSQK